MQIIHNQVQYTQYPGNEIYVTIEIAQSGEPTYYDQVKRSMWDGLITYIEDKTGDDLSLTAEALAMKFSPETQTHLPFMLIGEKLVRFTTLSFTNNGSGDGVYLVVDQENRFHLFESSYEPDCDGAYYSNSYKDGLRGVISNYAVNEEVRFDMKSLWNLLICLQ